MSCRTSFQRHATAAKVIAFHAQGVVQVLIRRLNSSSADGVVASCLRALTFIAGHSSTVGQITVLFVAVLSQHGLRSIQRIMDLSSGLYSHFFNTLHILRTNQQIEQARHRELLENSALALMSNQYNTSNSPSVQVGTSTCSLFIFLIALRRCSTERFPSTLNGPGGLCAPCPKPTAAIAATAATSVDTTH